MNLTTALTIFPLHSMANLCLDVRNCTGPFTKYVPFTPMTTTFKVLRPNHSGGSP